jgi:hypothetical protein
MTVPGGLNYLAEKLFGATLTLAGSPGDIYARLKAVRSIGSQWSRLEQADFAQFDNDWEEQFLEVEDRLERIDDLKEGEACEVAEDIVGLAFFVEQANERERKNFSTPLK